MAREATPAVRRLRALAEGICLETARRPLHYVCTLDQARRLIQGHERYWISNCGCREARGGCGRSRIDVCLYFTSEFPATGSGWRQASRREALELLSEAEATGLVARPFRDEEERVRTEGICFCCDDCCGYFLDPAEVCDRGDQIEATDRDACNDCGLCVEACRFGARAVHEGGLAVTREDCYGCGLCVDACSTGAVRMVARR